MQFHDGTLLHGALVVGGLVLAVGFSHEGQHGAIHAPGGLNHIRNVALAGLVIEVAHILAAMFLVFGKIIIATIGDSLQLTGPEREVILHVRTTLGIVCQLIRIVIAQMQFLARQAQLDIPVVAQVTPVGVPRVRLVRMTEELHLHLLELATAEGVVARVDLVAEALADLGDPEGRPDAVGVEHVAIVAEDALCRLGTQVGRSGVIFHRPDVGLEHQVELARRGQVAAAEGTRDRIAVIRQARHTEYDQDIPQGARRLADRARHGLEVRRGVLDQGHALGLLAAALADPALEFRLVEGEHAVFIGVTRFTQRRNPFALRDQVVHVIGPEVATALTTGQHGIAEPAHMTRGLPHLRIHDDRAV